MSQGSDDSYESDESGVLKGSNAMGTQGNAFDDSSRTVPGGNFGDPPLTGSDASQDIDEAPTQAGLDAAITNSAGSAQDSPGSSRGAGSA